MGWSQTPFAREQFIDDLLADDRLFTYAVKAFAITDKINDKAYIRQVLVDGVFHADPHPGNFRLLPGGPDDHDRPDHRIGTRRRIAGDHDVGRIEQRCPAVRLAPPR